MLLANCAVFKRTVAVYTMILNARRYQYSSLLDSLLVEFRSQENILSYLVLLFFSSHGTMPRYKYRYYYQSTGGL